MRKGLLLLGVCAALAPAASQGQIYDIKKGKLEFVGLKKWRPEGIREALGYKSFDDMHACASPVESQRWWSDVRKFNRESDLKAAVKLMEDRDATDRMVACAVLTNFPDRDEAYHALLATVRDPDEMNSGITYRALLNMALIKPHKVNWKPVANHLWHILNGTNLFGLSSVLRVLKLTEVDSTLAKELVGRKGGQMLLTYLGVH